MYFKFSIYILSQTKRSTHENYEHNKHESLAELQCPGPGLGPDQVPDAAVPVHLRVGGGVIPATGAPDPEVSARSELLLRLGDRRC